MKRIIVGALVASAAFVIGVSLPACDGGPSHHKAGHGSRSSARSCSRFATCDTCTPILGCGWCFNSGGAGTCAADPDECLTPQFSWTWDPVGCRVSADASVSTEQEQDASEDTNTDADASADADAAPVVVPR